MIDAVSNASYRRLSEQERNQEPQEVREAKMSSPERQGDNSRSASGDSFDTISDALYTRLSEQERNQEPQEVREARMSSPERQGDNSRPASGDSSSSYSVEMFHSNSQEFLRTLFNLDFGSSIYDYSDDYRMRYRAVEAFVNESNRFMACLREREITLKNDIQKYAKACLLLSDIIGALDEFYEAAKKKNETRIFVYMRSFIAEVETLYLCRSTGPKELSIYFRKKLWDERNCAIKACVRQRSTCERISLYLGAMGCSFLTYTGTALAMGADDHCANLRECATFFAGTGLFISSLLFQVPKLLTWSISPKENVEQTTFFKEYIL